MTQPQALFDLIPPGKLRCVVTGALRNDTPEENVRQTQLTTTPRATSPGAIVTFEQMGTWQRGDQPYGYRQVAAYVGDTWPAQLSPDGSVSGSNGFFDFEIF